MRWFIASLLPLLLGACGSSHSAIYDQHIAAQQTTPTDAGAMSYRDEGPKDAGNTIVLLHGVPTSSWLYRHIIPALAKKHRIIAPDLIGYGTSAKPKNDGKVYTPAAQAKRVRALMKTLGINQYSILMHDMGGLVAWEMMHQNHHEISNLICLNTIVQKNGFDPPKLPTGALTKAITKAFANNWTNDAILTMIFREMGLKGIKKLTPSECLGYTRPLETGSNEALYAFFTSFDDRLYDRLEQSDRLFQKFKGRTLILWGAGDNILTSAQIPFLKKHLRIPEENIHIYPNHAHFLPEEIPTEVVERVSKFLKNDWK